MNTLRSRLLVSALLWCLVWACLALLLGCLGCRSARPPQRPEPPIDKTLATDGALTIQKTQAGPPPAPQTFTLRWSYPPELRSNIVFNVYASNNHVVTNVYATFTPESQEASENPEDWVFAGWATNVTEVWDRFEFIAATPGLEYQGSRTGLYRLFRVKAYDTIRRVESVP